MADILSKGTKPEQLQVIHSRTARSFDEGQAQRKSPIPSLLNVLIRDRDQPTWLKDSFGLATPPIASESAQLAFPSARFTLEEVVESPIL